MGKLVIDDVGAEAKDFVQDGARHRAEAVTAHLVGLDAGAAEGGQHCVVGHRARVGAGAGEDITAVAGARL